MKSCGVSLTAAASAAARSLGVAGNDEEKMASGTATEIEEDFPKLTAQEKQSLLGTDRLDDMLCELSRALLFHITHFSCLVYDSKSYCLQVLLNRLCVFSVLYLQFTVWISEASRRWRHNEGLAVKGMPLNRITADTHG